MRIKQSLSKILPFFCIVIAPMEVVSIVLYISFVSLFIVVQLSYFQTLQRQAVGNGFQFLVVPVYLSAYPFDGLFITMNVEYVVQPKSFFGTAFSPWADSSELQGIVRNWHSDSQSSMLPQMERLHTMPFNPFLMSSNLNFCTSVCHPYRYKS